MPDRPAGGGEESLIALSAALAARDEETLSRALLRAREEADPLAVDEILLQAHLFVGFPVALRAMARWREVSGVAPAAPLPEDEALWRARGVEVCATVYGRSYSRLRERVAALHPDLDAWMVVGGYGRVIGRPGVELRTRELCIIALLAVWNAPDQLHSHLRGALHAGASLAEVRLALEIATELLDDDAADRVRDLFERVAAGYRHPDSGAEPTDDDA